MALSQVLENRTRHTAAISLNSFIVLSVTGDGLGLDSFPANLYSDVKVSTPPMSQEYARFYDDKHLLSDVLADAVVGIVVGNLMCHFGKTGDSATSFQISFIPPLSPRSV